MVSEKNGFEQDKSLIIFESLKRTDSYIFSMDHKASFTLAAGITFLGIYASLFYGLFSAESNKMNIPFLVSVIGIVLACWCVWFSKIIKVFSPDIEPSSVISIVSFASLTDKFDSFEDYYEYFEELTDKKQLDKDMIENHWICSNICINKIKNFKASLKWLAISLSTSILGLAFVAGYNTFI